MDRTRIDHDVVDAAEPGPCNGLGELQKGRTALLQF
ncbi:hypothetical protein R2APBS1_3184 [Rhodanobacter denitrificans]|uniref:Uncharacterized protein n=1 Tax=Rhodanobacter denitrificans TaxID=666685 RepID=M4NRT4_9GAMM|nr:hypothetical protein R2APBS1_3184 [Rhodanobacter denitrificans]